MFGLNAGKVKYRLVRIFAPLGRLSIHRSHLFYLLLFELFHALLVGHRLRRAAAVDFDLIDLILLKFAIKSILILDATKMFVDLYYWLQIVEAINETELEYY